MLRVQVRYASGVDEHPDGLDVGVSSFTGILFKLRHVTPNEFELADAAPGSYIVAAKARGFRTAVARTHISDKSSESELTVTLVPQRIVRVRWRSEDGRAISASLADAKQTSDSVLLEICATKFPAFDARPPDRHVLDRIRSEIVFYESPTGARVAREKRIDWVNLEAIYESSLTDQFGMLSLDEDGAFWANAYCRGVCVESRLVDSGQAEVEFVTPLDDLTHRGGAVKLVVVDDATGQPIEGASLRIDTFEGSGVSNVDGSLLCEFVPPGPRIGVLKAEDRPDSILNFTTRLGETTDLGTLRMLTTALEAHFRLVDEAGNPVDGVQLELADLDADALSPLPILSTLLASSSESLRATTGANIDFSGLQRVRHVLRCRVKSVDISPRIVDASELSSASHPRLIAEIVLRAANTASFVLDPPIAKGTQVVIETPSGLPWRELDVDEFGVATTDILAGSYKLHLVEYGRPTSAVDVHVDTNPFVFEIHR